MFRALRIRENRVRRILLFALFFPTMPVANLSCQDDPPKHSGSTGPPIRKMATVKDAFESVCASCHGLDGKGGERGPDIASRPEAVHKSDQELMRALQGARAASGMPSFRGLGSQKLVALVAYIRTLQGQPGRFAISGDAQRGKSLFFGRAKCSECHSVHGQGGFYGTDLSFYAAAFGPGEIREAILKPDRDLDPRRGTAAVVLGNSTTITGIPRNEDNFSLQLQTPDGTFHLLNKAKIKSITYLGVTAMPIDYASSLTPSELDDLVSFLIKAARSENPNENPRLSPVFEDGDEE
jgi:cytochrome c oxidase cbb3-type subunit III